MRRVWERLLSSFWFVPLLIALGALGLALLLVQLQQPGAAEIGPDAEGARAILSTIAGSMMTVVGVTFSMTLVALTLAAGQYSSRVLRNFMRDRVTQVVLGAFAGVFVYCVIVLRAVRRADDGLGVPDLAVSGGVALATGSIGVLIYFIHHVASSIQASTIIARVADETLAAVERQFPPRDADAPDPPPPPDDLDTRPWQPVTAPRSGYLGSLDLDALFDFARAHRTTVRVERGVGSFVVEGTPLVSVVWEQPPDEDDADHLRAAFVVGRHRTPEQDCAYGIRKLVDMAMRALSPGINDTTTAVMCVDYLSAILVRLAGRPTPPALRFERSDDAPPALRVVTIEQPFGPFVDAAFDQIRAFGGANAGLLLRLLGALETVGAATDALDRRLALARHVHAVADVVDRTIAAPIERVRLEARMERVLAGLRRADDAALFTVSAAQQPLEPGGLGG
ncbi:MAG: DUF2254 domain-containing protein [Myxococcales bacterium]|nr:DUF2254 domain-containing protein [Myxococcales bacterium]